MVIARYKALPIMPIGMRFPVLNSREHVRISNIGILVVERLFPVLLQKTRVVSDIQAVTA